VEFGAFRAQGHEAVLALHLERHEIEHRLRQRRELDVRQLVLLGEAARELARGDLAGRDEEIAQAAGLARALVGERRVDVGETDRAVRHEDLADLLPHQTAP